MSIQQDVAIPLADDEVILLERQGNGNPRSKARNRRKVLHWLLMKIVSYTDLDGEFVVVDSDDDDEDQGDDPVPAPAKVWLLQERRVYFVGYI